MTDLFQNKRGIAKRHSKKSVRISTHLSVMKFLFEECNITNVIEHGMGLASTSFFHDSPIKNLLSFENNPKWAKCESCIAGNVRIKHKIIQFSSGSYVNELRRFEPELNSTLVFVDGPAAERPLVALECMKLGYEWIVEHDAETYDSQTVNFYKATSSKYGYNAVQYIGENPEVAIYFKSSLNFITKNKNLFVTICQLEK